METKRVLQVNVDDLGHGGVFSLVMNLQSHMPNDLVFDFCSIERFRQQENIDRITDKNGKYFCAGYEGNKLIRQFVNFRNMYKFFKNNNYKVIHVHSDVAFKLFNYGLAAKLAGTGKVILHSHSTGIDNGHRFIKRVAHEVFKPFLRFVADDYFACSEKAAGWMFGKKKTKILYNAINIEQFCYNEEKRNEIRKNLKIDDKFVVGNVGRFAHQKNHELLIDVFAEIVKIEPESVLLLVGEGDLIDKIRGKAKNLGIYDKVIFYGVSDEVYNLVQAMDVFALTSRFEGLGIVVVEAQAAGVPAVCSAAVPDEAGAVEGLFSKMKENDTPEEWAERILSFRGNKRKNVSEEIRKSGYDINDVSQNLYDYYAQIF